MSKYTYSCNVFRYKLELFYSGISIFYDFIVDYSCRIRPCRIYGINKTFIMTLKNSQYSTNIHANKQLVHVCILIQCYYSPSRRLSV